MTASPETIAIVELGNSHDECIYSQILFLKRAGYTVHLVLSEGLKTQTDNFPEADAVRYFSLPQKGIKGWKELIKVKRYLKQQGVTCVVFNTATGNTIRNFIILNLTAPLFFAGTVHHTGKLNSSFTQRLISLKVKNYFVLNDYLLPGIKPRKGLRVAAYYPIFFPDYKAVKLLKPPGEFWICIPGQLEFKRRDYKSLLEQLNKDILPGKIKFILLGRCNHAYGNGQEVKAWIREKQLEDHFVLFDQFIDNALFHAYIKLADLVVPLIHEDSEGFLSYSTAQLSGAFNLAFAYCKPMLMHTYFSSIPDFKTAAFFYSTPDLIKMCIQLQASPDLLSSKIKEMRGYPKFDFVFQQQRYLKLLTLH